MKIAVVGLGYVGLPLSLQFARSCTEVIGIDVDAKKVELLNNGQSYIKHVSEAAIQEMVDGGKFSATTDFGRIKEVEAVIICVPTPLNKNREPDLSFVLETGRAIAPYLKSAEADLEIGDGRSKMEDGRSKLGGTSPISKLPTANSQPLKKLIVLESTTYPGTTDEELRAVLEENSPLAENTETLKAEMLKEKPDDGRRTTEDGHERLQANSELPATNFRTPQRMRAGVDFHLAFSPEREDPGNNQSKVESIPKVVGGYTPACLERAVALYSRAIDTIVPVSSCRVAEATKLLENIFRSVNIALVNELKVVYEAMGIDIWEVITAAKTKPFGFMPFYPGPGLGGHCIPIDPFYLTWKARECGQHTRFIELAGEINTNMPERVVHRVADALNSQQRAINGSKILVLGLAYKPNVDDERESPSYVLMKLLTERGAEVQYHDPYVPVIKPTREHPQFAGKKSVGWNRAIIRSFDLVLISTNHSCVNYQELGEWARCIVDTRNAMADVKAASGKVWKA
jgi:UDP-N-acetyl-D-glucosamine dehydrogenase